MIVLSRYKDCLLRLYGNLRGWRTKRKLLIIESDDWGATRIPSKKVYKKLLGAGVRLDSSPYDRLDCLESRDDFNALMNIIESHRDASGRPAIFTFNTVMGNPDFGAIESDDFEIYHHQHFFESYHEYNNEDLKSDWRAAIQAGLIQPQFHAREHLNVPLWMSDLKRNQSETRLAFSHRFYAQNTCTSSMHQKNYLCAYWAETPEAYSETIKIVEDGLQLFEKTFGFRSKTFIGCNYIWPNALEQYLSKLGVIQLQTQRGRMQPDPDRDAPPVVRRHYTGQRNNYGQCYSVRNVMFEPYIDDSIEWSERALGEINQAFLFNRPAIVCSHRINYVSGLSQQNRDRSLAQLDTLLGKVRAKWPEVEFLTSDELAELLHTAA